MNFPWLCDALYPPRLDGQVVADPVELVHLNWDQLTDRSWSEAGTRKEFCAPLRELEIAAGYTGPFAPYR